jgi:hypothetical protein
LTVSFNCPKNAFLKQPRPMRNRVSTCTSERQFQGASKLTGNNLRAKSTNTEHVNPPLDPAQMTQEEMSQLPSELNRKRDASEASDGGLTRSDQTLAMRSSSVAIASRSEPCILADNSSFNRKRDASEASDFGWAKVRIDGKDWSRVLSIGRLRNKIPPHRDYVADKRREPVPFH